MGEAAGWQGTDVADLQGTRSQHPCSPRLTPLQEGGEQRDAGAWGGHFHDLSL